MATLSDSVIHLDLPFDFVLSIEKLFLYDVFFLLRVEASTERLLKDRVQWVFCRLTKRCAKTLTVFTSRSMLNSRDVHVLFIYFA